MSIPSGVPDGNYKPSLTVVDPGTDHTFAVEGNPTTGAAFVESLSGFTLPQYDYVVMALSNADQTETYTFKVGGSGGSTVATVTIVYTDNTRAVMISATLT